jgi:hypothetical protein
MKVNPIRGSNLMIVETVTGYLRKHGLNQKADQLQRYWDDRTLINQYAVVKSEPAHPYLQYFVSE